MVLDTNVIYAALRSTMGASYALLDKLDAGEFEAVISTALVLEYDDVLNRPGALKLDAQTIADVLDYLCDISRPQIIYFLWRPQLRDPKDDMVLELAANAGCDYIVTFNLRDFIGSERFGVRAITPGAFLALLNHFTGGPA